MKVYNYILGELYEKAKQSVRESGYQFKKGYSRSKSGASSSENSSDDGKKRAKINRDERQKEISHLENVICKIEEQLKIKQSRIEKAKSVKDFKLCDQLSDSIRDLMREKRENEKQLSAFQKKESKSNWYRKRKNINNTGTEHAQKAKKMAHNFVRKGEPNQGNKSVQHEESSTSALPRSNVITVTDDVSRDDEGASQVEVCLSVINQSPVPLT